MKVFFFRGIGFSPFHPLFVIVCYFVIRNALNAIEQICQRSTSAFFVLTSIWDQRTSPKRHTAMTFSHLKQTNGKCVEKYTSVKLSNENFNVILFSILNISIQIYRFFRFPFRSEDSENSASVVTCDMQWPPTQISNCSAVK